MRKPTVLLLCLALAGCPKGDIGARCDRESDCKPGLMCLIDRCVDLS